MVVVDMVYGVFGLERHLRVDGLIKCLRFWCLSIRELVFREGRFGFGRSVRYSLYLVMVL